MKHASLQLPLLPGRPSRLGARAGGELGELHQFRAPATRRSGAPTGRRSWRFGRRRLGRARHRRLARDRPGPLPRRRDRPVSARSARTFVPERPGGPVTSTTPSRRSSSSPAAASARSRRRASRRAQEPRCLEINGSRGSLAFDLEAQRAPASHRDGGRRASDVIVCEADHPFREPWWPTGTDRLGARPVNVLAPPARRGPRRHRRAVRRHLPRRPPRRPGLRRDPALRDLGRARGGAPPVMSATKGREQPCR